jgi:hypothetical protein
MLRRVMQELEAAQGLVSLDELGHRLGVVVVPCFSRRDTDVRKGVALTVRPLSRVRWQLNCLPLTRLSRSMMPTVDEGSWHSLA